MSDSSANPTPSDTNSLPPSAPPQPKSVARQVPSLFVASLLMVVYGVAGSIKAMSVFAGILNDPSLAYIPRGQSIPVMVLLLLTLLVPFVGCGIFFARSKSFAAVQRVLSILGIVLAFLVFSALVKMTYGIGERANPNEGTILIVVSVVGIVIITKVKHDVRRVMRAA